MIDKHCLRKTACFFFVFVAGLSVPLARAQTVTLATLQAMYTNKVAGIESEAQKKKSLAVQEYGVDLQSTLKAVQKAGDFDGYVLVEKEIARFKSDKTVLASSSVPQLAANLAAYQKKLENFNTETAGRKIELCKQYLEALIALRKGLMLQNKIKEAGEVNDTAKQVESDIKDMESWQGNGRGHEIAPSKPETKLDELFGEEPAALKQKPATPEVTKKPEITTVEVKKTLKKYPAEALEFKGHYYLQCEEKIKWDAAKTKCQLRGGHLVTIESAKENHFLANSFHGISCVWIGFYKPADKWKWVSQEDTDFQRWAAEEPDISTRSPRIGVCIAAYMGVNGKWFDAYSDDKRVEGYICEWDE
jgi:hypothetical protein